MDSTTWARDMEKKRRRAIKPTMARYGARTIAQQDREWRAWSRKSRSNLVREYVAAGICEPDHPECLRYMREGA